MKISDFKQWQETRKEISLEEFSKIFPDQTDWLALNESPPEKIYIYDGPHYIIENEPGNFWLILEKDEYNCEYLDIQEMRLWLWCFEEFNSFI